MENMDTQVPTDWQQAHNLILRLLQGYQAKLEEMVQMTTQEAEAQIQLFLRQQDMCKKIKAQQMLLRREGGGTRLSRMSIEDNAEAYLESFGRVAMATKWNPRTWAARLRPLLIRPTQASY